MNASRILYTGLSLGILTGCGVDPTPNHGGTSSTGASSLSSVSQTSSVQSGHTSGPSSASSVTTQEVSSGESQPTDSGSGSGSLTVNISFDARVGQTAFACGQSFPGVGAGQGQTITAVDFRFYVSELRLINEQGQEVPVKLDERAPWQAQNVALVDFENNEGACRFGGDPGLNAELTGTIPFGRYRGLRFTLGVPSAINHQDPLLSGAPFQAGGMSWNWLTGFKFLAMEVRQDTGAGQESSTGLFHLGSTGCSAGTDDQGVQCQKSNRGQIDLPNFELGKHQIRVDLAKAFAQSDLSSDRVCHSAGEDCQGMFVQAGVDWDSGAPKPGQTLFESVAIAAP